MESDRANRRIDALYRHLIQPQDSALVLHPVLLNGGKLKDLKENEAMIIGGMVLDIHAVPSTTIIPGSTSPGTVYYYPGGVARNIAECMYKIGKKPFLISAIGIDMAGNLVLEHWKSLGLPVEGILRRQDIRTAVVCKTLDLNGELAAGVACVQDTEKFLQGEWIQQFKHQVRCSPVVMIDANLSPCALESSCQMAAECNNVPVWFEPVSVAKSRRVASIARYITYTSPNEDELMAMADELSPGNSSLSISIIMKNKSSFSPESLFKILKPAIWVLLEKGIKVVIVTLGPNGVFLCSQGGPSFMRTSLHKPRAVTSRGQLFETFASSCPLTPLDAKETEDRSHLYVLHVPTLPTSVKSLTGAGDCLVGGALASISTGLNLIQAISIGVAAAKATVGSDENVPSKFNLDKIADDARLVYSGAKVMFHGPCGELRHRKSS